VQHARVADGRTVAQAVIDDVAQHNADATPLGSYGVVVGATIGESVAELSGLNGPYLVPGIGAQGGTAADVRRIFGRGLRAVLPSVSREVLRAGPAIADLRAATERSIEAFRFLRPSRRGSRILLRCGGRHPNTPTLIRAATRGSPESTAS